MSNARRRVDGSALTVVVTGSEGFVGKSLTKHLNDAGYEVIRIDAAGEGAIDICDYRALSNLEIPNGAYFIHLAALSDSKSCKKDWAGALRVNIGGLANLLALAGTKSASKFVFASSEWVYCGLEGQPDFSEAESISLDSIPDFYARTKFLGERLLIGSMAGFPTLACRFGIVYGPRDVPGSAIEDVVLKQVKGEPVKVGSKNSGRSFIHVNDLVSALVLCLDSPVQGVLNLAGSQFISLGDIYQAASDITGRPYQLEESGMTPDVRGCSILRAREELNWVPEIGFMEGIAQLVEHYEHQN